MYFCDKIGHDKHPCQGLCINKGCKHRFLCDKCAFESACDHQHQTKDFLQIQKLVDAVNSSLDKYKRSGRTDKDQEVYDSQSKLEKCRKEMIRQINSCFDTLSREIEGYSSMNWLPSKLKDLQEARVSKDQSEKFISMLSGYVNVESNPYSVVVDIEGLTKRGKVMQNSGDKGVSSVLEDIINNMTKQLKLLFEGVQHECKKAENKNPSNQGRRKTEQKSTPTPVPFKIEGSKEDEFRRQLREMNQKSKMSTEESEETKNKVFKRTKNKYADLSKNQLSSRIRKELSEHNLIHNISKNQDFLSYSVNELKSEPIKKICSETSKVTNSSVKDIHKYDNKPPPSHFLQSTSNFDNRPSSLFPNSSVNLTGASTYNSQLTRDTLQSYGQTFVLDKIQKAPEEYPKPLPGISATASASTCTTEPLNNNMSGLIGYIDGKTPLQIQKPSHKRIAFTRKDPQNEHNVIKIKDSP